MQMVGVIGGGLMGAGIAFTIASKLECKVLLQDVSAQAVAALRASGVNSFHAVNIFEDPELRDALKKFSNWPTYPQLYVKGELVGGCDIVLDMHRSGELKKLLSESGAV